MIYAMVFKAMPILKQVGMLDNTDFDVDFRQLFPRTGLMSWKTSHHFTGWANISAFRDSV